MKPEEILIGLSCESKEVCGIYGIFCVSSGNIYIGQSRNIKLRWAKHKQRLKANKHENDHLQKAYNKYGKGSFVFYILEEVEVSNLTSRELYYVTKLDRKYLYNMGPIQDGFERSEDLKRRISEGNKGKKKPSLSEEHKTILRESSRNRVWTEEMRKNLSIRLKGKPKSEEHKAKIREQLKKIKRGPLTEAHKLKLSLAKKGHFTSEETKKKISESNKKTKAKKN